MNQEVSEQIEQSEAGSVTVSAGQQLRDAREARGLSRDEVAAELRLHIKLIAALEENNRKELPPAAFVSGYLRAYAKLLDLPAEKLIADYLNEGVVVADYRPTDRSGERVVTSHDPKFRLISYGVVGLLLLLFGLWWVNDRYTLVGTWHQAAQQGSGNSQQVTGLALPPLSSDEQPASELAPPTASEPTEAIAVPAPNSETSTLSLPSSTSAPQPVVTPPSVPSSKPTAPAVAETTQPVPSPKPAAQAVAEATLPAPVVVTSEPLPLSTPQATLRLEYQAASWTQVEDANGRVLVYETVNPGRKLELHGVAPFKVFLGYAQGVTVYYNGSLFSHAAYQRGDLARFRVGSRQDNRPLDR